MKPKAEPPKARLLSSMISSSISVSDWASLKIKGWLPSSLQMENSNSWVTGSIFEWSHCFQLTSLSNNHQAQRSDSWSRWRVTTNKEVSLIMWIFLSLFLKTLKTHISQVLQAVLFTFLRTTPWSGQSSNSQVTRSTYWTLNSSCQQLSHPRETITRRCQST